MRAFLAGVLAITIVRTGFAQPVSPDAIRLADLERLALERNPTLQQASSAIEAAKGRARQAGTLPNPLVGYAAEEVNGALNGGKHGVFAEQVVPLGGKLGLSRKAFEALTDERSAELDAQRQRLLTAVRRQAYRAAVAAARVSAREELALLVDEAVLVSYQLFNTGAADRPDVLEAEVEAQKAKLALIEARNARYRVWKELGATIGEPELEPRPLADVSAEEVPELQRARELAAILRDSPELASARFAVTRSEALVARATREPAPDLVLRGGALYNRENAIGSERAIGWEGEWAAGLTVPLFNRNRGAIAAESSELLQRRHELARREIILRRRFATVFDGYLTALSRVEIYRDQVLPRARQAHALYLASYQQMAAAYPQVLVAQRMLIDGYETYLDALDRVWQEVVAIRALLPGDDLEMSMSTGTDEGVRQ